MSDTFHDPIQPDELDGLFARFAGRGPCALAVSGGSDSTALMVLYADWLRRRRTDPGRCTVLTVDHRLRSSSADEARAVGAAAAELGFQHVTLIWEGAKPKAGIQAAARSARYRLMGEYMREHGISLLLTAHTRDDQAETLLMRLARGSGLDGLSAMAPLTPLGERGPGDGDAKDGGLWIGRPVLDVPKACLQATLEARGIRWMEDPSNIAPEFERARLRAAREQLDVLGLTTDMLALSAARLARARRAIEAVVARLCEPQANVVTVDPCGVVLVDRVLLREVAEEVALRVLERAILAAGGAGGRAPLSKLEAVLYGIWDTRSGAQARWTLARALITAEAATVRIERETGRQPLPELTLAAGETTLWDGRFQVTVGAGYAGGAAQIRALGDAGLRDLRRRRLIAAEAPTRAAATVPAFWRERDIVAVPSLDYWGAGSGVEQLEAEFIGLGNAGLPVRDAAAARHRPT